MVDNPYFQWLAIPLEEQPPHFYRLLGLPLYESDMGAITQAADRRIAFVKAFQTGADAEIAYRVLNELMRARTCLLSMVSKWEYDRRLQEHFAALAAAQAAAVVAPPLQTPASDASYAAEEPLQSIPGLSPQPTALRRRRKVAMLPLVVSAVILGLICMVGIAAWRVLASRDDGSGPSSLTWRRTQDAREQELTLQARGQATGVEAGLTVSEKANLQELLNQARAAMTARDMDKADRCTRAAVNVARGDERALAGRVRTLFKWVDLFWQLVGTEIRHFEPGRELHLEGMVVAVVETEGDDFTVRAEGRNRRFAMHRLPPKIAEAIANGRLSESGDDRELCLGAFWAVDRWGDRALGRRHWEQAGEAGRMLMAELPFISPVDSARPDEWGEVVSGRPPEKEKSASAPLATPPAAAPSVPTGRQPQPDPTAAAKAAKIVEQTFGLVGALSALERTELVAKLCRTAQTEGDAATRWALYRAAVDQAVKVANPDDICKSIDALDEHFAVDALELKTKMLWTAYRSDRGAAYRDALVKQCAALLTVAMNCQNYAAAEYAVRVAILGAQTSKDLSEVARLEKLANKIRAEKGH